MSTVREQIAEQIRADNPTFIVDAFPTSLPENMAAKGLKKTYVQVFRESLEPTNNGTSLLHSLKVTVFVAKQHTEIAENDLDEALDLVLLSLERLAGIVYTSAIRDVLQDKYNVYEISVSCTSQNVYKNIVREEQKEVTP